MRGGQGGERGIFRGFSRMRVDRGGGVCYNKGREINFLAQKDNKKYYIQVAYSVADEKAYNREFSAFADIDNLSKKIKSIMAYSNEELNGLSYELALKYVDLALLMEPNNARLLKNKKIIEEKNKI